MSRPVTATPERILEAAFIRFSRYGFRRTSMEDIAVEAGVSRAALYLQFRNKEEIFRRLAEGLHEQTLNAAAAALGAEGTLAERLAAAAEAKTVRFIEIAHDSPHGNELIDESNRLCGDLAAEREQRFQALVTKVFRRAVQTGEIDLGAVGLSAAEAAELFARTVSGLKTPGVAVPAYRRRLSGLVRVFVAAMSTGAAPAAALAPRLRRAR